MQGPKAQEGQRAQHHIHRHFRRSPQTIVTLAALLLAWGTMGCSHFDTSGTSMLFPEAMLSANFQPARVTKGTADPFGWLVYPEAGAGASTTTRQSPAPTAARAAVAKAQPASPPTVASAPLTPVAEPAPPAKAATKATATAVKAPVDPPSKTPQGQPKAKGPLAVLADAPEANAYDTAHAAAYVAAVYGVNGVVLSEGAPSILELYQHAYRKGVLYHAAVPAVGDLAFFHNTYDRNRDGRWNDWYTLVAVVESVDANGTVTLLAYVDGSVQRFFMNLAEPGEMAGPNGRLNTVLRASGISAGQSGMAGKLFAGFANLLGDANQVVVIDNWQPGMRAEL